MPCMKIDDKLFYPKATGLDTNVIKPKCIRSKTEVHGGGKSHLSAEFLRSLKAGSVPAISRLMFA
jgi:hypothetical protein